MSAPFYVTTPIYYVNDIPHLGHLYTTLAADTIARYHRLIGDDVRFLTGTDEHGQKIEKKAREQGITPLALADRVVGGYQKVWTHYGVENDDFIRTTEDRHKKVVRTYIAELMAKGDVYLDEYEGWYCVSDEAYLTDSQVADGKSLESGRPVERLKEESYFFRMSKYADRLLAHIEANPHFIVPDSRRNEVTAFIKGGLKDLSISRTTIKWGIPFPEDTKAKKEHSVYVWFDALTNYISALKEPEPANFERYWHHAVHFVGKDILRFHAVYWPTFLMALGVDLPQQIVAHGWLTDSNRKMSKSSGKVIEPVALANEVGVDGVRFFLFREFTFGQDGEFTKESMYRRINADLANDYGNGVSRVISMVQKYYGEGAFELGATLASASEIRSAAEAAIPLYHRHLKDFAYEKALGAAWEIVGAINKAIEVTQPWALAKSSDAADQARLRTMLAHAWEGLRVVSLLVYPWIPTSARTALTRLGSDGALAAKAPLKDLAWGTGPKAPTLQKGSPLFPRLEFKPEAG